MLRRLMPLLAAVLLAATLCPPPAAAQGPGGAVYINITGTASINGADLKKPGDFRGVMVVVNVTTLTGTTPTITPVIQGKDDAVGASGNYIQVHTSFTAISAAGTFVYMVYPAIGTAAGGITATSPLAVPNTWRVVLTYGGTVTASAGTVAYYLIP